MRSRERATTEGRLPPTLPFGRAWLSKRLASERPAPRGQVASALTAFLHRLGAPKASLEAARALAHPQSRAVVTGQQAGLLGGPALTFYKAHTAISLAKAHHSPKRPVVAIFWVASQDHDTEEVASTTLVGFDEEPRTLHLALPPARPVGKIPFAPYAAQIEAFLKTTGFAFEVGTVAEVVGALEGARTYSEAFCRLMLRYLGPRGLIVLDPMAPELAPLFTPVIEHELEDPLASSEAINRAGRSLRALGFKPGLGRGQGATNVFLEGDDGIRRLLRYQAGTFSDGQKRYQKRDLLEILRSDPTRLTPAAGLRPVAQDSVLPTAGLVVGPGELAYVALLPEVYRLHRLEMPAVLERLSALVLEPPIQRILDSYGLDPWDFVQSPKSAMTRALGETQATARKIRDSLARIEQEFEDLLLAVMALDPTLKRAALRSRERVRGELTRLKDKVARNELLKNEVVRGHFSRLCRHLVPEGKVQETIVPYLNYVLKHGHSAMRQLEKAPDQGRANIVIGSEEGESHERIAHRSL